MKPLDKLMQIWLDMQYEIGTMIEIHRAYGNAKERILFLAQ